MHILYIYLLIEKTGLTVNYSIQDVKIQKKWPDKTNVLSRLANTTLKGFNVLFVRSLSVSFFIEKELHKQPRMKRKRKGEREEKETPPAHGNSL